jgi:predicted phage tail protein
MDVKSPAEAVRAIMANRPDFRAYMIQHSTPGYHVLIGNDSIGGAERLHDPSGRNCIKIIPVIAGAGGGGILQIVIGVVLIAVVVAAFVITGPGGGLLTAKGALTAWGSVAVAAGTMGAGMLVGGITQMLTGMPEATNLDMQERPENRPSFLFNGPVNTTAQGHPVAVGYGRLRVGSAMVSAGVATEDIG